MVLNTKVTFFSLFIVGSGFYCLYGFLKYSLSLAESYMHVHIQLH
jgi:hypothetical protein